MIQRYAHPRARSELRYFDVTMFSGHFARVAEYEITKIYYFTELERRSEEMVNRKGFASQLVGLFLTTPCALVKMTYLTDLERGARET